MFNMNLTIKLEDLKWSSDWDGHEVGYDNVNTVSLYTQCREDGEYNFYISAETYEVLDFWKSEDDHFCY